ncbi:enolase 4 isoform X1 [Poecilia latipinna]|uniref:enolase 4 isoform X1 n=1 Tax=Poecilia latipinna TaxID=48699 RepID=UPI00072E96B3|nr:PREDICTED: enolase-like protein ENO4 isoform X1 [Poecilia latipinna]
MDIHKMRIAAAEFYRRNGVPAIIERALNELFLRQPADVHGYLANFFLELSTPPRISDLRGREVFSENGQLIVEVEVFSIVCNKEKSMSSAAVVSHFAPVGTEESQRSSDHVETALQWIHELFRKLLLNQNPCDQAEIDQMLSDFFRSYHEEEKARRDKLKAEASELEAAAHTTPVMPSKEKKSAGKGKKSVVVEKQFPPPEPPEPLLLEGMAVGSVSLAVAKSGAKIKGMPLYKYISALKNQKDPTHFHVPVPWITLLSCGKKSPGKLCLLEEIILISKVGHPVKQSVTLACELQKEMMRLMSMSGKGGITLSSVSHNGVLTASCERPDQPLDLITNACTNLKVPLGVDVFLALNCAAPKLVDYSKGKYEVATGGLKSPDELIEVYNNLISKYPAVVAVIDPFRREEAEQWKKLSDRIGISCSLLSDITHKAQAPALPGVHGYVFRHANETTVSDIIHATFCYQGSVVMDTMLSESSSDGSFADLAVGLGLDYVKLGGLGGAETMAKYNRLISIEEELAQQGLLVCKEPPLFSEKPKEQPATAEETI